MELLVTIKTILFLERNEEYKYESNTGKGNE